MFQRHQSICTKRMSPSTPPTHHKLSTILANWSYLSRPWELWFRKALSASSFDLSRKSQPSWFPRWIVPDSIDRQQRWQESSQGTLQMTQGCNQCHYLLETLRWFRWRLGKTDRLPRTVLLFLGKRFSRTILQWSRGREVLRMLLALEGELW